MNEEDVSKLVHTWLVSQNDSDFEAYAELYGESFEGIKRVGTREETFNRQEWLDDRERMFERPMQVRADGLIIRLGSDKAEALFSQSWESGDYKDVGPKRLVMELRSEGPRIVYEEMVRSTVGRTSRAIKGELATTEELLSSSKIVAFASKKVALFDARSEGDICEGATDCSTTWMDLGAPRDLRIVQRDLLEDEAHAYLDILSSPSSYGASPAACFVPRLALAFYHEGEELPWATVGVCIECATVDSWPGVTSIQGAIPAQGSGLGDGITELNRWCEAMGFEECAKQKAYYQR